VETLAGAIQRELAVSEAQDERSLLDKDQGNGSRASRATEKEKGKDIAADRRALMEDIRVHPYDNINDRYARLGWSFYRGNRVRDALVGDGLVELHELRRPDGMVMSFPPLFGQKRT
jgi:hypothetical protein